MAEEKTSFEKREVAKKSSHSVILPLLIKCWHDTETIMSPRCFQRDIPKRGENLILQIEVFALETNKKTNTKEQKTQNNMRTQQKNMRT